MNKELSSFECIWKEVILNAFELCDKQMDGNFKEQANVTLVDREEYKENLEIIYKRKREWLKLEYLPNENNPILDFHKLSALMCRCIVGVKPYCYDVIEGKRLFKDVCRNENLSKLDEVTWQVDNVYVNYKLAFLVAEGIAFVDLLFWAQKKINEIKKKYSNEDIQANLDDVNDKLNIYQEFLALLNNQQGRLLAYKTSNSHDDFITSAIIALMKSDYLKRDFDYLQFSLNMFQWQEHTKYQLLYHILIKLKTNLIISDIV